MRANLQVVRDAEVGGSTNAKSAGIHRVTP